MTHLIVIGGGPAGEAAARYAARKKASVTMIEKAHVGGLCLNKGCIPSKTLLSLGKRIFDLRHSPILKGFADEQRSRFRQELWQEMKKEKERVIQTLRQNLEKSLKSSGINVATGQASFISSDEIRSSTDQGDQTLKFDKAVIAVGSAPFFPPPLDSVQNEILNSDRVLEIEKIPESLVVVGGGAVGCEYACLFNELGVKVTLVEKMSNLLPGEDELIVNALRKSFENRGIGILVSTTIEKLSRGKTGWDISLSGGDKISAQEILACVGRRPNFESLDLSKAGIMHSRSGIEIDASLRTSNPRVFSAGDVTGLSLLAHAGSAQGEIAAANALDENRLYDGSLVPRCLYTWPEVASVGMWMREAESKGIEAKSQRFFFQASGRAIAEGETEGFIQMISDKKTDRILGAQIIGSHATEMIHIISIALKKEMTRKEIREVIFAHPTLSEGIREALER